MQRELMIRYLLGELSETEQRRLEESLFTDPAFLREFQATRDDLVDAFVRGELKAQEKARFERCLRSSPTLVEKVDFARTLLHALDSARPAPKPNAITRSLIDLKSFFGLRRMGGSIRPILGGIVTACLLIIAGVIWAATQLREKSTIPNEASQIASVKQPAEQQPVVGAAANPEVSPPAVSRNPNDVSSDFISLSPPAQANRSAKVVAPLATFLLTAAMNRGIDDQFEVVIPALCARVRLQLEIEEGNYPRYQVLLQKQKGKKIWAKANVPAVKQGSGQVVICDLPSRLLENGSYVLSLYSRRVASAAEFDYYFRVTRP